MIFLVNIIVLILSLTKYRALSKQEKAKARRRFLLTNYLNAGVIAASLLTTLWSSLVTPATPEFQDPIMYAKPAVLVVAFVVWVTAITAAIIGIYNIRKYSLKRSMLIF